MARTVNTDRQQQTASGGGGSSPWGKLLFTVETDRKRVGLEILIRLAASAFAVFLYYFRGNGVARPLLAVLVLFTVWPLLHMGDRMELYQRGVVYKGELYPIGGQTRVTWVGRRGFFLPITWLEIGGTERSIKVSFMKDAEKLFNRAYNGAIY